MRKIVPLYFWSFLVLMSGFLNSAFAQTIEDTLSAKQEYQKELKALTQEFTKDGFEIELLLKDDRFEVYESIGDRFKNSAERKTPTLDEYKSIIHFDEKIDAGVQFMKEYAATLQKAEQTYGIPKYVITAIIGVESKFGENIGNYNPFNVYVSMIAVNYRSKFAKAQLKELLEFTQRKELDIFTLKSSYAGAMSYAQFIPYSVNKWWVGDDIFDMNNNILSVANYLSYFKKRTKDMHTTIRRYNPSDLYAGAVLDLADAIEKKYEANQKK